MRYYFSVISLSFRRGQHYIELFLVSSQKAIIDHIVVDDVILLIGASDQKCWYGSFWKAMTNDIHWQREIK